MELSPQYRAARFRQQVRDSLDLALKASNPRSLALLIDTAIESRRQEAAAEGELRETRRRL